MACTVCLRHGGSEICRSVAGATRAEAERAAIANACAILAAGVTATLDCQRTQPLSMHCDGS